MRKKFTVLLAIAGSLCMGYAQESVVYTHEQKTYQDALTLYNNKQYQAAQTLFEKVLQQSSDPETKANSAYYVANAAVRLNQLGADRLMEDFVERYPTSVKRNSAFMDVADYYFENGRYPYAMKWYGKVDQSSLSRKDRARFDFNMGYALFSSRKPEEAKRYLNRVSNSPLYGSQAKYYLGYIAYQQDDYEQANERFDQITDQEVLEEKLSYYQADMNFKLGNFEEAIAQAKNQLPKSDRREVSELNKIIGESYFNLGQYSNAIPYLEDYKGKRGKWSNTDYYQLGYAYYKQEDFANAIQQFNKIINGQNDVAQNAYYHLAECYLKLEKKQEALNAFRNASQMEFNAEISKDALLNYARLSYEIGNAYEPVPQVLSSYLERYPKDEHQQEIQELLVDSYITSRNFEGAMELLEANKGFASNTTYQKVAFYRGLELFLEEDYPAAQEAFSKSLSRGDDQLFKARAHYWKAESAYALNDFELALTEYVQAQQFPGARNLEVFESLDYQLAYTYFKLKDYSNAIAYFKKFTESGSSGEAKTDSWMRLGDSYFVSSSYQQAIAAYDKALRANSPEQDYAAYQKAMSLGFLSRGNEKIQALRDFINRYSRSTLKDDALFELGNSYVQAGQEQQAIAAYDQLQREYRMSSLLPSALMRKGLIYYNSNRNQEALKVFKEVAAKYPNTADAVQAVATAKLIYMDLGQVDQYATWVRSLDFVEVSDQELELASYEAAEKQWVEGNKGAAARGFEKYLQQFPGGIHSTEVHFKLAQIQFAEGEAEKALPHFKYAADTGLGETAEQALTRVCEILISRDDYRQAMPYLERLENTADIPQNRTFAQSNLMKGYFGRKEYQKTLAYAEKVLGSPALDNRIRSDARVMIARSAMELEDFERARGAYNEVLETGTGEIAAEALYYSAYFKRQDGDFEGSNTAVQRLAKDFSAYKKWGGRGLILMARNFADLEDAFQATYILENVISNFTAYPEITDEAKEVLNRIKVKEAERNSSVNPNEN